MTCTVLLVDLTVWNNGGVFGVLKREGGLRDSILCCKRNCSFDLSPSPSLRDLPTATGIDFSLTAATESSLITTHNYDVNIQVVNLIHTCRY